MAEHAARYSPITFDTISQQAYVKPAAVGTTQEGDQLGFSVAVSGDTMVVGAPLEDSGTTGVDSTANESASSSGAAYVFVRTGSTWSQQAYLKPAAVGTTQNLDQFGFSVAVSGDTVVVGAPLEDSSETGVNRVANEAASTSGAAYVFVRTGSTWSQQAYLKPATVGTTQAGDKFGSSVAVSGDTLVVGASLERSGTTGVDSTANESASFSGAAYVFVRTGSEWSQQAYLKPAAIGTTQVGDQFGFSVAVSGDTVVVGAPLEDSGTTGVGSVPDESSGRSGAAYVFVRTGSAWGQQAYLKPAAVGTTQMGDQFGFSVGVSGDTVVVGAPLENSGTTGVDSMANESAFDSGAAYVFVRTGSAWTQQAYLKPTAVGTKQTGDEFGFSVAASGERVVVGATFEDGGTTGVNSTLNEGAGASGAAYVFLRTGSAWTQQAYLKPAAVGTQQAGDCFAFSVAVSSETVVVGAPFEDSSTAGVNSTANESALDSGAAYVFIAPTADIGITKTDGVSTATPGGSTTYTIVASNGGPSDTTATVADTFPATLTCTWTCGGEYGGTCTAVGAGDIQDEVILPNGASVTYTALCAISVAAKGSLVNTATVSGAATDPDPGNDSATDTDTLTALADLGITKTDGVTSAIPGGSTTYTIVASNSGPPDTTATVADTFPATLTCTWTCVGAGGGICTAVGAGNIHDAVTLPNGASVTYTAICAISVAAKGRLVNTATVSGAATDPIPGNNSATDTDRLIGDMQPTAEIPTLSHLMLILLAMALALAALHVLKARS